MSFSLSSFIVAIMAISTMGWIATTWIRARHGYPVEGEWGGSATKSSTDSDHKINLLSAENDRLAGKISRLEERIAVLERIATDAPSRLTAEIDSLK